VSFDPFGVSQSVSFDPFRVSQRVSFDPSRVSQKVSFDPFGVSQRVSFDPFGVSQSVSFDPFRVSQKVSFDRFGIFSYSVEKFLEEVWYRFGILGELENLEKLLVDETLDRSERLLFELHFELNPSLEVQLEDDEKLLLASLCKSYDHQFFTGFSRHTCFRL